MQVYRNNLSVKQSICNDVRDGRRTLKGAVVILAMILIGLLGGFSSWGQTVTLHSQFDNQYQPPGAYPNLIYNDIFLQSSNFWHIETVDSLSNGNSSLALDNSDNPHISYEARAPNNLYDLNYARMIEGQWQIEKVAGMDWGGATDLALENTGNPQIIFTACNFLYCTGKYTRWVGTQWGIEDVNNMNSLGSLAIDTNAHPNICFTKGVVIDQQSLNYTYWTGSAWVTETVDGIGNYSHPSLKLDNNNPHVSYYGEGSLKYAYRISGAWNTEIVDSLKYVGQYSSLAIDSVGYPHISYYDWTNGDLKYAKSTGSSWSIETVDSTGDVGQYTSLALDTSGHPHIVYFDNTNKTIKYAHWTGNAWLIDIVSSGTGVGDQISLKLDTKNQPHVSFSYYSNANDYGIKYAWEERRYSISGEVTDANGVGLSGITISVSTGIDVKTNEKGFYTINNVGNGGYILTPIKSNFSFIPIRRLVTVPPELSEQNFTAIPNLYLPMILRKQ
jgi:hypothetical protein